MIIHNTICHQINMIFKQKSLMSKKYSHSCSSFTNVNSFSGKHNVEYSTHHSDRMYQFTFLILYATIQRCNPRQKSTFVQFHKILPKFKLHTQEMVFAKKKKYVRLSSIHTPASLDIKFFRYFYIVIWVANHQN